MQEVHTVQAWQTGDQKDAEFWDRLCVKHGNQPGCHLEKFVRDDVCDRKQVFFY